MLALLALLAPLVTKLKEKSQSVQCIANLRALHTATHAYAGENQGELPVDRSNRSTGQSWYIPLTKYLAHPGFKKYKPPYFCPSISVAKGGGNTGWTNYAINSNLYEGGANLGPAPPGPGQADFMAARQAPRIFRYNKKALYLESSDGDEGAWFRVSGARYNTQWRVTHAVHGDRLNVIFLDGHAESPRVFPRTINADGDLNELQAKWFWPVQ